MIYEFPLHEGVRRLLRVEMLFDQVQAYNQFDSEHCSISALSALVDLVEVVSKNNLRLEMIKQLERIQYKDEIAESQQQEIKALLQDLVFGSARVFDEIKENIFLNVIRQRLKVMGGIGNFDLPSLHHWLRLPHSTRSEHLGYWFDVLRPTKDALDYVLKLIRSIQTNHECGFKQGLFYKTVKFDAELIRLDLTDAMIYPEFSGNKQQISIRLMEQSSPFEPVSQIKEDLMLTIELCG